MLQLAQESMDRFPSSRRHHEGGTFAIPASKMPEIKRRLGEFMEEIGAFCSENEPKGLDEVIQININAFPLSTRRKSSK